MNNLYYKIKIAFGLAWNSLRLNILRTSLTVLGMVIGVAAILVVFSAGDGISELVSGEVESYGSNVLQTDTRVPSDSASFKTGEITSLKIEDMEAINKIDNVITSYASSLGQEKISYTNLSETALIMGVSAPYILIDNKTAIDEGAFFSEEDDESQSLVVVLGSKLKETLFGDQSGVGKLITIDGKKFRVLGSLEEQGGVYPFMDFNEMVYMPIKTLHKRIMGIDYAMSFKHQIRDVTQADETALEISYLLRERHDINNPEQDDFKVSTTAEIIETLGVVTNAITLLLFAIVLISLLVGGVGIMNIMYVTVSERTPEIGLRKALGATKKDVTLQFLIEAILITFWGWLVGALLGLAMAYALSIGAKSFGLNWNFSFPISGILVSLVFSISSGFIFGYRPAKEAANLDPIVALRQE